MVCVIPGGSAKESDRLKKLSSFSRVNEMDLIRAVLTGCLDPSILISACSKYLYICRINVPFFFFSFHFLISWVSEALPRLIPWHVQSPHPTNTGKLLGPITLGVAPKRSIVMGCQTRNLHFHRCILWLVLPLGYPLGFKLHFFLLKNIFIFVIIASLFRGMKETGQFLR